MREGKALPHDGVTVGEICARGNSVFAGYWKQPAETAKYIVDGWFHTGDMGSIDDEGYVSIVDRKKDIIITGGENVASIEIEKAIYEHPSVLECAVIGVPDEHWGEVPAALIVLKPGTTLDVAELIDHCRAKLAHFKVPKHVQIRRGVAQRRHRQDPQARTARGRSPRKLIRRRRDEPRADQRDRGSRHICRHRGDGGRRHRPVAPSAEHMYCR